MLVELPRRQSALRGESALEVAVLGVDDLEKLRIVAADSKLSQVGGLLRLSAERRDGILQT